MTDKQKARLDRYITGLGQFRRRSVTARCENGHEFDATEVSDLGTAQVLPEVCPVCQADIEEVWGTREATDDDTRRQE